MSVLHSSLLCTEQERLRILAHLDELVESPAFSGSRRRQAFLRYVVEEALAGRGAAIKERNIAVDVFERNSDFDAQSASVVRVTGGEVRKRLAQAYASGLDRGVRIELPLGSYQPAFHFDPEPAGSPNLRLASRVGRPVTRPAKPFKLLAAIAAIGVVAAGALLLPGLIRAPSATDRLWQPFLNPDSPVLISLATLMSVPAQGKGIDGRPAIDTLFVGTGGALGAARFAEQLALRHQPFSLKFGSDVAFSDLKSSSAILLGTTRWTDELMRSLRFRIERGAEQRAVVDSRVNGRMWSIPRSRSTPDAIEGYSVVTRLLNSESGHPVLLVAGLDPRDTQAGVEFLSNNGLFERFAASLPPDWARKSFQAVLHNSIHGNSSGSLTVVAFEVW